MHESQHGRRLAFSDTLKRRVILNALGVCEEDDILAVPPLDLIVIPNYTPDTIQSDIIVPAKYILPVVWPLLVNVQSSALTRNSGRKQNQRRKRYQVTD